MTNFNTIEDRYLELWNFVNKFSEIGVYPTAEEFWKLVEEAKNCI